MIILLVSNGIIAILARYNFLKGLYKIKQKCFKHLFTSKNILQIMYIVCSSFKSISSLHTGCSKEGEHPTSEITSNNTHNAAGANRNNIFKYIFGHKVYRMYFVLTYLQKNTFKYYTFQVFKM